MGQRWEISIPVRPKAVQSTRFGKGGFHVDQKVVEWKKAIRPYVQKACSGRQPSQLPIRAVQLMYIFKLPSNVNKKTVEYIRNGGIIPYTAKADLTDNLSKGVVDVCKGLVFEDDSQIWHIACASKQYGLEDGIYLVFEETEDMPSLDSFKHVHKDKV